MGRARDIAKHPPMHRTAPTTMNYPVPNASSAKVEELLSMINVMWQACYNYEDKAVKLGMKELRDGEKYWYIATMLWNH